MAATQLTPEELTRYDRQIGPGVLTEEEQLRLKNSTVVLARVGGMGGPASLCLTMAGVGHVIIAHGGKLISPDLNRQVLASEAGLGQPRMPAFADYLRSMNGFVQIEGIGHEPTDEEMDELAARADLLISCPPGFEERMRMNRSAVGAGKPLVDAAQWGMTGTLIVVDPGRTACLQCVYPTEPEFEELFPVVGGISSAIGSLAALEAVKILSGRGRPMYGQLWNIDAYQGRNSIVQLARDPQCPCCGAANK